MQIVPLHFPLPQLHPDPIFTWPIVAQIRINCYSRMIGITQDWLWVLKKMIYLWALETSEGPSAAIRSRQKILMPVQMKQRHRGPPMWIWFQNRGLYESLHSVPVIVHHQMLTVVQCLMSLMARPFSGEDTSGNGNSKNGFHLNCLCTSRHFQGQIQDVHTQNCSVYPLTERLGREDWVASRFSTTFYLRLIFPYIMGQIQS